MNSASDQDPVTFKFAKSGGSSTLTVAFDEKRAAGTPDTTPTAPEQGDPARMQMMKAMFQGFKVAIDLEVEGKIIKTNADHVAGSKVTLLEMDLEALLADEAKLKEVQKALGPNASVAELTPDRVHLRS